MAAIRSIRSHCLLPWPNDHFVKGGRLALRDSMMPRNKDGRPIRAADYNRSNGFSPGQIIVTHVPRARPAPQRRRARQRHGEVVREERADRRDRREDRQAPADLGRARLAGDRSRASAPCSSTPARTGARAGATSWPCATCAARTGARCAPSAPSGGCVTATPAAPLHRHLPPPRARRHQAPQPLSRLGLHDRDQAEPGAAPAPHPQPCLRRARRPQAGRPEGRGRRAAVQRRFHDPAHAGRQAHRRHLHRALLPRQAGLPARVALQAGRRGS